VQRGFDRRRISATVLLAESSPSRAQADFIRRQVFERLNTGGQQLNAQELRNSLYAGVFNDLLIELAGNRLFNQVWDIPAYEDHYRQTHIDEVLAENKLFKRMIDCEIVLRYFAFRRTAKIRGSVRTILDDCMGEFQNADSDSIAGMREDFLHCLTLAHKVFGDRTFST
jgi:hypothetical protein